MNALSSEDAKSETDLHEDHGRDLLGSEGLVLTEVLDLDSRAATLVNDLEGPRLNILLHDGVIETATNQTPFIPSSQHQITHRLATVARDSLDVEDGVLRVHGSLVLGSLTDQTLLVGERNERGSSIATLVVGN